MSAPNASIAAMKLVGVQITPAENDAASVQRNAEMIRQAAEGGRIDLRRLPKPKLPALPVFADDSGQRYVFSLSPVGPAMVPIESGLDVDPRGDLRGGGFVPMASLQAVGKSAPSPMTSQELDDLRAAALRVYLKGQTATPVETADKSPEGKEPKPDSGGLGDLAQSITKGAALALFSKGVELLARGGGIEGALRILSDPNGPTLLQQFSASAARQLGSMATGMLLSSLWSVDDESSTAETAAHKGAEVVLDKVQGELVDQALGKLGLDKSPGDPIERIQKFFALSASPSFAAIRQNDIEDKGNPVIGPCSTNVTIEGQPAARVGDSVKAPGVQLYVGSQTVTINGKIAPRIADTVSVVGKFPKAAVRTFIGGPKAGNSPPPPVSAAGDVAKAAAGAAAGAAGAASQSHSKPESSKPEDADRVDSSVQSVADAEQNRPQATPSDATTDNAAPAMIPPRDPADSSQSATAAPGGGHTSSPWTTHERLSKPEQFAAAFDDPLLWDCPRDAAGIPCLGPPVPVTFEERLYAQRPNMRDHLDQVFYLGDSPYNCVGQTGDYLSGVLGIPWKPRDPRGFDPVSGDAPFGFLDSIRVVPQQVVDATFTPYRNLDELLVGRFDGVKVPVSQFDMSNPDNRQLAIVYQTLHFPSHAAYNTPDGRWVHVLGPGQPALETPDYDDVETPFSHPAYVYVYPRTTQGQPATRYSPIPRSSPTLPPISPPPP